MKIITDREVGELWRESKNNGVVKALVHKIIEDRQYHYGISNIPDWRERPFHEFGIDPEEFKNL